VSGAASVTDSQRSHASASSWEFGGPVGVTAMMLGFPLLMYYLWMCCWFYDGQLAHPKSVDDIVPFLNEMWEHVRVVRYYLYAL
jgi:delta24(24(1))-sterol reductase